MPQVLLADGSDFDHFAHKSKCRGLITRPDAGGGLWSLIKKDASRRSVSDVGEVRFGYSLALGFCCHFGLLTWRCCTDRREKGD